MKERLLQQYHLIQAIRDFFRKLEFLDVLTPPAVENPGMETHIHPFQLTSKYKNLETPFYLHTSPEFHMKELLSLGFKKIFNISYCFRDEPQSPIHRFQFLMLEWYRSQARYELIMDDCEKLIISCLENLKDKGININSALMNSSFERMTIQELFIEYLNVDILNFLDKKELVQLIKLNFPEVPLPKNESYLSWDDVYFLFFLNKIEPQLKERPYLLLYEFPHHLSALSTLKKNDPRVCERFEIYIDGIELCNCFNELTDLKIQKDRFNLQRFEKNNLYGYDLPEPTILYQSLERGLPPSAGVALGVERLLMALTKIDNPFFK
jgi:lysyl-tRNA synthetase class 2